MKYTRFTFILTVVSTVIISACSKDYDDLTESTPITKAVTEMSLAVVKMNDYQDSLIHHAVNKTHYEKMYHHHDSLFAHHDKNYHHAIPATHPSNADHVTTHHTPYESVKTIHHKSAH